MKEDVGIEKMEGFSSRMELKMTRIGNCGFLKVKRDNHYVESWTLP